MAWCTKKSKNAKAIGWVVLMTAMVVIVVLAAGSTAVAAKQKTIKLRFSSSFMPPEPPNIYANHTLDLVEKKTNGRVKIQRFMGGALGGPLEQLDLGSSGATDIISLHIDQYSQRLPLHQVTNTEQLVADAQGLANVTAIVHKLKETKPLFDAEQKKNNIKILHFYANGPTGITAKFQAKSLADLKGKKLNVIAAFQRNVFKEVGWIPVNVQIPELYEALSRGVIDGIFMATAANVPLKWFEIGKTHLAMSDNTVISSPLAFNLDSWNRLPEDIQKAFLEASWETAQWSAQQIDFMKKDTYKKFEDRGAEVVKVSDKETRDFFNVLFKESTKNWLNVCKAAGVEKDAKVIQKYWDQMKWGKWKE